MESESEKIDDLVQLLEHTSQRLKTTENFLADITNKFRVLFESIPFGLLIANEEGKIQGVNPTCEKMFGYTANEMFDRGLSEFFQDFDCSNLMETCATAEGAQVVTGLREDGTQFAAEILLRSFSTTKAAQILVSVEDITPRFEIERMKREFVSMISHDLRSPLTSTQLFLGLISDGAFDERLPVLKDNARSVELDTVRLLNMINSLLDIDKMEAGKFEMFIDIVLCRDIIQQATRSLSNLAEYKGVELDVDMIEPDLYVLADQDLAVQVIVNLLSNAIKFSPEGKTVRIAIAAEKDFVKIDICDQGPGIDANFRQRMFNRFEQAKISDARIKGGSGLGLAVSKNIVEQLGGTIGADSEEGKGSTFWFTLKRAYLDSEP